MLQKIQYKNNNISFKFKHLDAVVLYHFAMILACLWLGFMALWDYKFDLTGRLHQSNVVLLVGVSMLLSVGVFWFGIQHKNFDIVEIVYPITALYILHYPLRALFILFWSGRVRTLTNWPVPAEPYLAFALGLFILGMSFFYLGYFWFHSSCLLNFVPKIPFTFKHLTEQELNIKIAALYSVGFIALVILFIEGTAIKFRHASDGSVLFQSQLTLLGTLRVYALYLVWTKKRRTPSTKMLAFGLLGVEVIFGVVIGSKQAIFQTLLAVIFASYYVQHINWRRVVVPFLLIFLFVVFPLVQNYRIVYKATLGQLTNPTVEDLGSVTAQLTSNSRAEWQISTTIEYIGNRASYLDSLTMVVHAVPDTVEFQHGRTLISIITGFIPRIVWLDKPNLNLGRFMVTDILQSNNKNSEPITAIGEFYLNFGLLAVPVGMFLLGMFYRACYAYVWRCHNSRIIQAMFYLAIFPNLLFGSNSGIASTLIDFVRDLLIVAAITWFLSLRLNLLGNYASPDKK